MEALHFERYEYKYFLSEDRIEELRRFIRPYTRLDEHAQQSVDHAYTIHSIYFDTPTLELYHAGLRDAPDRYKLRVRWYDSIEHGQIFCEVKRKIRQVIVKDRARMSREELDGLLCGRPLALAAGRADPTLASFLDRTTRSGAVPVMRSRYSREAYESVFGEYARITFDRAMCYQSFEGDGAIEDPLGWRYIDGAGEMFDVPRAFLIELKFSRDFPRWMSDLVAELDLVRCGFSKYIVSMTRLLDGASGGVEFHRRASVRG